jgi:hypothetical protein
MGNRTEMNRQLFRKITTATTDITHFLSKLKKNDQQHGLELKNPDVPK